MASNSASVSGSTESRLPLASSGDAASSGIVRSSAERHEPQSPDGSDRHPIPARILGLRRRVVVGARRVELRRVGLGGAHDLADAGGTRAATRSSGRRSPARPPSSRASSCGPGSCARRPSPRGACGPGRGSRRRPARSSTASGPRRWTLAIRRAGRRVTSPR